MPTAEKPVSLLPRAIAHDSFVKGEKSFYVTGGTLPPTAPSYITRQADTDLYEALIVGQFCYVLNTRQIGKSSLMIRTVRRLKEDGAAVAVLDLTAVGQNLSAEQWYDGLVVLLSEQLQMEDECERFWRANGKLGPLQRFFATLKEVVLPAIASRPLILFVDEIDSVRSLPFSADEFFAGIRECYNRRVQDATYDRLTFCIIGVATPADLIQDTRMSPFNIGRRVKLMDFRSQEATPLAQGMGPNGDKLLERALYWTNGHPYLTQRLCREISRERCETVAGVDQLTRRHFLSKRALDSDDNLSFVQNRLLHSESPLADVLDFYDKLRRGDRIKDDETNPLCGLLRLAGIATVDERTSLLRLRNRIYATVFDRDWVQGNMPDAELRRQRHAAFTARIQVGSVAAVVIISLGALSGQLFRKAEEARDAANLARSEQIRAENERNRANIAEETAKRNQERAENSTKSARKSAVQTRASANAATASERRAKAGETKAVQAEREALAQRNRADIAAKAARSSAAQAEFAKDEALKQKNLAEVRGEDSEVQRKEALVQTEAAETQRKRAEAENAKASVAAEEASLARFAAEQQRKNADAQRKNADEQRKNAELSLERLNDYNRRRSEQLRVRIANNPYDIASPVELAALYFELAAIYDDVENRAKSLDNYAEAAKAFGIVLKRKPGDYPSLVQRGFCYMKMRQYNDAITDFSACIIQRPREAGSAYLNRARSYQQLGKYNDALRDLALLEKNEPVQMDYLLRGQCLMAVGLHEQAVESFSQELKKPNPAAAAEGYVWIGDARRLQGEYEAAYSAYTRYQELHPEVENVYRLRIDCLLGSRRWKDVARECVRYSQRFPRTGVMYPWHAYALLNQNDLSGYRALCLEAMERFGGANGSAENANFAAWTCALGANGLTDYEPPLRIAQKAVDEAQAQVVGGAVNKTDPLGALWANRNTLAALLLRAGKYGQALRELDACEAMPRTFTPDNRFSDYILYVLVHARNGNRAEAARYLRMLRALPPSRDIETTVEQRLLLREAGAVTRNLL
ncbi:MAG: AAA-like domain-containing protein [Akkermansiaceae bacterium]|nr:AAA-like domain-containing protein [Armatimonadota bacterium]